MLPFIATDLLRMLKNLMSRFLKPDILQQAITIEKLLDVKVKQPSSHLNCSKVDLGYITGRIMSELSAKAKVGQRSLLKFKMSCKECLLAVVDKLLQKSPLNYTIVKNLSFLDPTKMP